MDALRWTRAKNARAGEKILALCVGGEHDGMVVAAGPSEDAHPLQVISLPPKDTGTYFVPWPNQMPQQRDVHLIAGPSGVGKSVLASRIAEAFGLVHGPQAPIHVVSAGDAAADDSWKSLPGVKFLPLDARLGEIDPVLLTGDAPASMIVFDDVEDIHDKKIAASLSDLLTACLKRGRHGSVYVAVILHQPAQGAFTKAALSEATLFDWFPQSALGNIGYALRRYAGIPDEVRRALKGPEWGRYICASFQTFPAYVVSEKRVALYDEDSVGAAAKQIHKINQQEAEDEASAAGIGRMRVL